MWANEDFFQAILSFAQSAEAAGSTDCTSAEG